MTPSRRKDLAHTAPIGVNALRNKTGSAETIGKHYPDAADHVEPALRNEASRLELTDERPPIGPPSVINFVCNGCGLVLSIADSPK